MLHKCDYCSTDFSTKGNLQRHINNHCLKSPDKTLPSVISNQPVSPVAIPLVGINQTLIPVKDEISSSSTVDSEVSIALKNLCDRFDRLELSLIPRDISKPLLNFKKLDIYNSKKVRYGAEAALTYVYNLIDGSTIHNKHDWIKDKELINLSECLPFKLLDRKDSRLQIEIKNVQNEQIIIDDGPYFDKVATDTVTNAVLKAQNDFISNVQSQFTDNDYCSENSLANAIGNRFIYEKQGQGIHHKLEKYRKLKASSKNFKCLSEYIIT